MASSNHWLKCHLTLYTVTEIVDEGDIHEDTLQNKNSVIRLWVKSVSMAHNNTLVIIDTYY